jgi:hypothetical protein
VAAAVAAVDTPVGHIETGTVAVAETQEAVAVEHIEDIDRVDMKGFEDTVVHLAVDPVESIEVQDTLAKEGMREKSKECNASNARMNIVMRELSCCLSFYKYIYTHLFI